MKTDIFDKARALGQELAACEEYAALRRARAAYDADIDAQTRAMRIEELTEEIDIGPSEFVSLKALEEIKAEAAMLQAEIEATPSYKALKEADAAFSALMDEVSHVIDFTIDGEAEVADHGGRSDAQGYRQVH